MLKVGDKVKITTGTHKGKWGYVFIIKDTFCQVKCQEYLKSIARGDSEDLIEERTVRAKKTFIEKIPDTIIEMPTAAQLQPVASLDDIPYETTLTDADQVVVKDLLDGMPVPENDDDILSKHSSEATPVDITSILPNIEQALSFKEQCETQAHHIQELEDKLVKMGIERLELQEACDMFIKLSDYIRGRLEGLQVHPAQ
jgi:methionine aminopeptidase